MNKKDTKKKKKKRSVPVSSDEQNSANLFRKLYNIKNYGRGKRNWKTTNVKKESKR